MTVNISQHYNTHIKNLNQNHFIYKVKKAFYLLTNQEERLYEVGFNEGFLYAANVLQKESIQDSNVKKIIGYRTQTQNPKNQDVLGESLKIEWNKITPSFYQKKMIDSSCIHKILTKIARSLIMYRFSIFVFSE